MLFSSSNCPLILSFFFARLVASTSEYELDEQCGACAEPICSCFNQASIVWLAASPIKLLETPTVYYSTTCVPFCQGAEIIAFEECRLKSAPIVRAIRPALPVSQSSKCIMPTAIPLSSPKRTRLKYFVSPSVISPMQFVTTSHAVTE